MKYIFPVLCFILITNLATAQKADSLNNKAAPQVHFQYTEGKHADENFYKGKILVLDFWATWCAPCIANFPHFNKLAGAFQNKDVVFAITSDEPLKTVHRFFERTKKQVNAFNLIDTSKSTMKAFMIESLPYSVVIDKNNVIRWVGSGALLTDTILSAIIKNGALPSPIPASAAVANDPAKLPAPGRKTVAKGPMFSFSVTFSDTIKKESPGGGFSTYYNDYINYSSRNKALGAVLTEITGYSKSVRVITNDAAKLNRLIDMNFDSRYDTTLFEKYNNALFAGRPRKNMIVSLLSSVLKFDVKVSRIVKKHYELVITDSVKLHTFMSMQSGHSSFSDSYFPKFEIVGYSLKNITAELENSAKMIITTGIADQSKYDLSLDISNLKTIQQTLAFHGVGLKEINSEVEMLTINFY